MVLHERRSKTRQLSFEGTMFEQTVDSKRDNDRGSQDADHSGISEFEAAASIAKAIMGAGSFALPWAFSNMGYIAGPIFMFVLMIFSVNSLDLLVKCSRTTSVRYSAIATSNSNTTGVSVEDSPKKSSVKSTHSQPNSYVDVAC